MKSLLYWAFLVFLISTCKSSSLPTIEFEELKEAVKEKSLKQISNSIKDKGGFFSSFAITNLEKEFPTYIESLNLMQGSPELLEDCLFTSKNSIEIKLADGSTRKTFATVEHDFPECAEKPMNVLNKAFNIIEIIISNMIEKIAQKPLYYSNPGEKGQIRFNDAPSKDHVHLYQNKQNNNVNNTIQMVPYHIDNGVFLIITPFKEHGLNIKLSDGSIVSTDNLPKDSVVVIFGLALNQWLFQADGKISKNFKPGPHAVNSISGTSINNRVVYARMKIAPAKAKPFTNDNKRISTFEDVFMRTNDKNVDEFNKLCSTNLDSWSKTMQEQCNEGEAYCWMNCLPLAPGCSEEHNICLGDDGHKCTDNDMDTTCEWVCTDDCKDNSNEITTDSNEITTDKPDEPFCYGGTDMLMTGFEVAGKEKALCIILFFSNWTLDTEFKFAMGCIGVFCLGFGIEALITLRRRISNKSRKGLLEKSLLVVCFGTNLILGYLAMLVAMTYSIELFLSVCVGITLGHVTFNLNTAVGETIDPCCAASQNNQSNVKIGISLGSDDPAQIVVDQSINSDVKYDHVMHTPAQIEEKKCCKSKN